MHRIRLQVLGSVDLRNQDAQAIRSVLSQPRRTALLAYLAAARPAGFHRRDTLLALFWPESADRAARDLLNTYLYRLRGSLGAEAIQSRGNEEVGLFPEHVWCDVDAFEAAIRRGTLDEALEFYRGHLLDGFHLSDAPGFERWLDDERDRLRRMAADAAAESAEEKLAAGDALAARRMAEHAVSLDPRSEAAARRAIELLDQAGDRPAALRLYDDMVIWLRKDFESEPSPETERLVERVRARSEPAGPAPVAAVVSTPPATPAAWHTPRRPPPGIFGRRVVRIAALLLLAGVTSVSLLDRAGSSHHDVQQVAVFPFTVRGAPEAEYLREGVMDLLTGKLDGVGTLTAVDPRAVLNRVDGEGTVSRDQARRIAQELGAGLFIFGTATQVGTRLQIDASLVDGLEDDQSLGRSTVEGGTEEIFDLVDRLARSLLASRFQEPTERASRVGAQTTRSVEALRRFLEGEQRFRSGDYDAAADAYRAATVIDPDFALAHYGLSSAAAWTRQDHVARTSALRALELAGGLPQNEARLIEGWNAYLYGHGALAEQTYREVVTARPSHVEAWYRLSEVLFHYGPSYGGTLAEAREALERLVYLEPNHVVGLVHLARLVARDGDATRLDSLLHLIGSLDPSESEMLEVRTLRASLRGDPAERAAIRRELGLAGAQLTEGIAQSVVAFGGDLGAVEALGLTPGGVAGSHQWMTGRVFLAHLAAGRGRWRESVRRLDELAQVEPAYALETRIALATLPFVHVGERSLRALRERAAEPRDPGAGYVAPDQIGLQPPYTGPYAVGLLDAALGDFEAATEAADELHRLSRERVVTRNDTILAALHSQLGRRLRAEVQWRQGDFAAALRSLGPPGALALQVLPGIEQHAHAAERFLRATLLHEVGRSGEALAWLEAIPDPSAYDVAFIAPAHLLRASIHEANGDLDAARRHYGRVVTLWGDADPEFQPMADAASDALERLGNG